MHFKKIIFHLQYLFIKALKLLLQFLLEMIFHINHQIIKMLNWFQFNSKLQFQIKKLKLENYIIIKYSQQQLKNVVVVIVIVAEIAIAVVIQKTSLIIILTIVVLVYLNFFVVVVAVVADLFVEDIKCIYYYIV